MIYHLFYIWLRWSKIPVYTQIISGDYLATERAWCHILRENDFRLSNWSFAEIMSDWAAGIREDLDSVIVSPCLYLFHSTGCCFFSGWRVKNFNGTWLKVFPPRWTSWNPISTWPLHWPLTSVLHHLDFWTWWSVACYFQKWKKRCNCRGKKEHFDQDPECLCNWSYAPHTLSERLCGWQYWALFFHRLCFYGSALVIFSPDQRFEGHFSCNNKRKVKKSFVNFTRFEHI